MSTEDIYWKEDVSKKSPQYHHRYASMEHKLFGKRGICARVVEDPDNQITKSELKRLRDGGEVGYSLNKQKRWEWFVPEVLLHEEEFHDQTQVYFREESVDTNIWGYFQRVKKLHYLDHSKDEVKSIQLGGAQNTRDARMQLSGVFEGSKKDAKGNEIEKVPALSRVSYVRRTCLPLRQLPVKRLSRHIKWKKCRWYTEKKELSYEIEDLDDLDGSDFEDHYYYDWVDPTEKRSTTLHSLVDYVKETKNNDKKKKKKRTESPLEENSWEIVSLASASGSLISDLNEDIEFVEEQENQLDYPKAMKLCEIPLESPSKRRIRARPKHFANPGNFKGMGMGRCSVYTDLDEENEVEAGTRVVECIGCSTRLVVPLSNSPVIRCAECKIGFCSQCGWEPHYPLSCDVNREWCRRFDIQLGMKIHEDDIEKQLKRLICHCGAVTEFGDKNSQKVCSICHKLVNAHPRRYERWFFYPRSGYWWKIPTPETDNVVHKDPVIDSVYKISLIDKRFSEMAILGHCWRRDDKKVIKLQRAIKNLPYAKGKEALKQIIFKGLYILEYGAARAYQNRQLKTPKQRITWEKLQKLHEQIRLLLLDAKYVDLTSNCVENIESLVDFLKFD
ncbi:unnamed protein product, partial [Mesorhabditis belari]|uniref:IBR domain-containing protein n=1 Tax=Mesorhabditis belari TaxID=2138241 RepID=A0AAF3FHM8_9BILA